MFVTLLSFNASLETTCLSLNNEIFMARPNLIDLYSIEINFYLLMVSLDKFNGNCNAIDHLSRKICVSSETKGVYVKACKLITRKYEGKTLICMMHWLVNNDCVSNQKWKNDKW